MAEFASKGWASLNTVLGSIGTAGATGILGNLFGNATNCNGENSVVNRYEVKMLQELAAKDSKISLLESNIYNDNKTLQLYQYIDGKIEGINSKLCDQAVFNATQTAAMNCMGGQIAQLYALTKLVVPNTSVCPGWGNVTVTPATTTPTT